MPLSKTEIEKLLTELGSEDDWGSWELWWNISADVPTNEISKLKNDFLDVVSEMVASGKLIPKRKSEDKRLASTAYDREQLSREIDASDKPDPDNFLWFGAE